MRVYKLLAAALAILWIAGVSVEAAFGQSAKLPATKKEKAGLIRMDLLKVQRGEVRVPKRNIFSPQSSSRIPGQGSFEAAQKHQPGMEGEQTEPPGQEAQAPPAINVNLRYIGFIEYTKSSKKMTALIILEGQVMAVAEGEVVSEGIRIGKITPQELEVIMPDSTTRKFSLEGE